MFTAKGAGAGTGPGNATVAGEAFTGDTGLIGLSDDVRGDALTTTLGATGPTISRVLIRQATTTRVLRHKFALVIEVLVQKSVRG